jgi:murein DD-endopeptidase MepM/ murein hydrolase activator NlpD
MSTPRFMPLKAGTYRLSSPYGPRGRQMRWGLDFAANDGTHIYAAQAGSVQYIGAAEGFGQWIVIDHPRPAGGGTTVYGHMWDAFATGLRRGQSVTAGQHIAYVGNNGQSSGPHLHFEVHPTVWRAGSQIDPMPWLAGALDPGTMLAAAEVPVLRRECARLLHRLLRLAGELAADRRYAQKACRPAASTDGGDDRCRELAGTDRR